jgi:hypothetical protein
MKGMRQLKCDQAHFKDENTTRAQWPMSIIPATQEAEIRITVQGQPKQKVNETPSQPITGWGDMCL